MLRGLLGGYARGRRQTSSATLSLNFLAGINDSRITYSGGANGTRVNSSGVIVAATAPRFDYNPVTLAAKGLLVEEARTNSLRNNSMTGAVVGTPGTAPTNWTIGSVAGVTSSVSAVGTDSGIAYIDIRWVGTAGADGSLTAYVETATGITAATAQTWTVSTYLKLQAGSAAGVNSFNFVFDENTAAGAFVANGVYVLSTPNGSALISQRQSAVRTLSGGGTVARVRPYLFCPVTSGAVVDITLRIGYPQMELGAFATSVIPTTSASVTRTADSAVMTGTNFSSWYNQSEGTFVVIATELTNRGADYVALQVDDNSTNNRFSFATGANNLVWNPFVITSGVSQAVLTQSVGNPPFTSNKLALSYAANNFAATTNAAVPATDLIGTVPAVDRMRIGTDSASFWNGHIQSITYYPRRMADSQLQTLTA